MLDKKKEQVQLLHVLLLIQIAKVHLSLSSAAGPTDNNLICDHCQCSCPGSDLVLICNVSGSSSGSTIWKGTGFNCIETNNEVVLDHNGYTSGVTDTCNDGRIFGEVHSQGYRHFVSKLTISVTSDMNGTIVQCFYDDGTMESLINETIILIPSEHATILTNLRLDNINNSEISISWDPDVSNCSQHHYNIFNQNCGVCPSATNLTRATCQLCGTTLHQECILSVQPVICNDIIGVTISSISITMKLLEAPRRIDAVSNCNGSNDQLVIYLRIHDSERNHYNISIDKDGSPHHYTITYVETENRTECGSETIPATSCPGRVCEHAFDVSNSSCSTSTMFAVYVDATNDFGSSPPLTTEVTNECISSHSRNLMTVLLVIVAILLLAVILLGIVVLILASCAYHWKQKMERTLKESCYPLQYHAYYGSDRAKHFSTIRFSLADTYGSLCTFLKVFKDKGVSIGVLNTLKRSQSYSQRKGYIRVTCTEEDVTSLINGVQQINGASVELVEEIENVQGQIDDGSDYKMCIRFSLKDESGSLYDKLKILEEEKISIGVMNTLMANDVEGNKSGYIACDCTDATLLEHLFDSKVLSELERREFMSTYRIST